MPDITEDQSKRYIKEVFTNLPPQDREKLKAYADALRISQFTQERDS